MSYSVIQLKEIKALGLPLKITAREAGGVQQNGTDY
jgi:hypothetical protein